MCARWNEAPRLHLIGQPAHFENARKMAAGGQARCPQLGCPGAGVPVPIGIAVALRRSAGARRAETVAGQTRRLSRVKYSNWGLYRSGCSTPSSRRSFWRRIGLRAVSQSEPDRTASTTAAWPQGRRSRARGPVGFASWRPQLRYAVARGPGRRWLRISTKRAASARLTCQAGLVR